MTRWLLISLGAVGLIVPGTGCASRLIKEGMATVTGASGRVVDVQPARDLSTYRGFRIDSLGASAGLRLPPEMAALVRQEFDEAAAKQGLTPGGSPALRISGEIIHYESGGIVDEAIGPLEEVVVRTRLSDADSGAVLTEANLIGRSKATVSGGAKNLAEGSGKALRKWLKECGIKAPEKD